jgi:hypothetical protein
VSVEKGLGLLARALRRGPSEDSMKKESVLKRGDDMRKEYDLSKLPGEFAANTIAERRLRRTSY